MDHYINYLRRPMILLGKKHCIKILVEFRITKIIVSPIKSHGYAWCVHCT